MASPGCSVWKRCPPRQPSHHHHHHHHHHCLHYHHNHHNHNHNHNHCYHLLLPCAHHNHHLHCPFHRNLNFSLPQKPESSFPFPVRNDSNVGAVEYKEAESSAAPISQELEHLELDDEEDDDEPIFVLTDEWRDFFAQSEARRRLEKKQSKKGKKKT